MNQLLQNYSIQVDYPDVSGAEHLEILQIRDRLAELETDLTIEEGVILAKADRKLMMSSSEIYKGLSEFIDLPRYRLEQGISAQKWWWYLDVLNYLPSAFERASAPPGGRVSQSSMAQRDLESA